MSDKPAAPKHPSGKKRPYRTPALTKYGTLRELAKGTAKGGSSQDGGKPSTRAKGPPG
jgi:hypothetical protein